MDTYSKRPKVKDFVDELHKECEAVMERYPLLKCLGYGALDRAEAIVEYIRLIDNHKQGN
jgi:hypothetical protein